MSPDELKRHGLRSPPRRDPQHRAVAAQDGAGSTSMSNHLASMRLLLKQSPWDRLTTRPVILQHLGALRMARRSKWWALHGPTQRARLFIPRRHSTFDYSTVVKSTLAPDLSAVSSPSNLPGSSISWWWTAIQPRTQRAPRATALPRTSRLTIMFKVAASWEYRGRIRACP
jgi:hypothetical protein